MQQLIDDKVHRYYWEEDLNCAATTLKTLAAIYNLDLHEQVLAASIGMHGAGKFGAQCGLVEGALMFIGIYGTEKKVDDERIVMFCHEFAQSFELEFGSLLCKELRLQGFSENDPPHLCESKTKTAIGFTANFIRNLTQSQA